MWSLRGASCVGHRLKLPWEGNRHATEFRPECIQPTVEGGLYLTVPAPSSTWTGVDQVVMDTMQAVLVEFRQEGVILTAMACRTGRVTIQHAISGLKSMRKVSSCPVSRRQSRTCGTRVDDFVENPR